MYIFEEKMYISTLHDKEAVITIEITPEMYL